MIATCNIQWIQMATKAWTTNDGKVAAQRALQWVRAACTSNPHKSSHSCIALDPSPVFMDQQVARWATYNLASYLPKPKASPSPVREQREWTDKSQASVMQHALQSPRKGSSPVG